MSKIILHGNKAKEAILAGMEKAAKAVGVTLGPCGYTVVIDQFGSPKITKDGVSVIKKLELDTPEENIGLKLLQEAAKKSDDSAGDGTTTTTVLAYNLSAEGFKHVRSGMNPMDIRRGMEKATDAVIGFIKKQSQKVDNIDKIRQVATISANGDKQIGDKLAEAFEAVGQNGVVTVEEGNKQNSFESKVVKGMNFDRGYLSPYFVTNGERMLCEFESPYILIVEKKLNNIQTIIPLLEAVMKSGKPLVVIAEDVEGEALTTLIVNKLRGGLKVAAVKAPGFGDRRKAMMEDIAIVTGATVISEDLGHKLEDVTLQQLGTAKRMTITKDDSTIVDGAGDKDAIESRAGQIKREIDDSTSDYDKEKLEERLAKLTGGIAVLSVGGVTEVEVKEKKDRVEDAYHATKAAIQEGVVAGGGCTLLHASSILKTLKGETSDEQAGIDIVRSALSAPASKIIENAGLKPDLITEKIIEKGEAGYIYDAKERKYVNAFEAGIIDPTKIVRTSLQSAASVAGNVITTETMVFDKPEEKKDDAPSMPAGGMGGMPGMGF